MASTTTTTSDGSRTEHELTQDEIFDLLSNRRRRFVIHALKRADGPVEVSELATYVTAWERGIDPETVEYDDRRNVHTTLKRTHLPTLEEKNVIRINEDDNLVEPTPTLEDLDIYVEVIDGDEIPWSTYYVGLSGLSVAMLLATYVEVPLFARVSPLGVGVATAAMFGVSALFHRYYRSNARLGNTDKPPEARQIE
jgi:hypothetical protein